MDWTGYPKGIDAADTVDDLPDLAAFLGVDAAFVQAYVDLAAQANAVPGGQDQLAVAFPRETVAWGTWESMSKPVTAGELLSALLAVPDTEPEAPPGLLPLILRRLQVTATPDGGATVNLSSRVDSGTPWRDQQWKVPAPAVEIDPALLQQTTGAQVSVRLTVQAPE